MKKGTTLTINKKLKGRERANYQVKIVELFEDDVVIEFIGMHFRSRMSHATLNEIIVDGMEEE